MAGKAFDGDSGFQYDQVRTSLTAVRKKHSCWKGGTIGTSVRLSLEKILNCRREFSFVDQSVPGY